MKTPKVWGESVHEAPLSSWLLFASRGLTGGLGGGGGEGVRSLAVFLGSSVLWPEEAASGFPAPGAL